ncbi:hypothetical protein [Streptomyces sp. NPDC060065]|uniref:hypothetical protein n=1 Tax=Streptomyces sp. NPDC060065 TaxID=3347050 RepID=UPI00369BCED9
MAVSRGGRPAGGTAKKFPTGANYAEALQHPELCFSDPDLKHGTVQQTPVLGPKAISGNFASVFSVTAKDGRRYALKCFTRDSATLGKRYGAISSALGGLSTGGLSQPWPVGFDFLEQGVRVEGSWFPMVKMAWAEGTGLVNWIERNRDDTAAVHALADRFLALIADLDRNGIAHGDLQHGNLLVADDGTFRLVDYDGMYVPALRGEKATENGHRNYQSPNRTAADYGPAMDRFSAWVIELSLLAVAVDPGLWGQLNGSDVERLIISESDFKEPAASLAWQVLLGHHDERLRALATQVRGLVGQPCAALPPLTADALALLPQRSAHGGRKGRPTGGQAQPTAMAAGSFAGAVPAWMEGRIAAEQTTATAVAQQAAAFGTRRVGDLVAAATALLSTSTPGVLALTTAQPGDSFPAAQGMALVVSAVAIGVGRRLRPEYQGAKVRARELRVRSRELKDPAAAHGRLEQEIHKLDDANAKDNVASDKRIQALQTDLRDGQARITVDLNRRTSQAQKKLAELPTKEASRIAAALEPAIRAHVQEKLRKASIHDARTLTNMGPKMIRALVDAGFHTAADFTGVAFSQSQSYANRNAYLVRPGGQRVRVPGIGEARATTLEGWRHGLEKRARASAPTKMSAQATAQIRGEIAMLRAKLKTEVKQAEGQAEQSRTALQKRITDERQRLTAERQQRRVETQRKRAELLQRQKQLAGAEAERARVEGELAIVRARTRRSFGTRKYLKFLLTGC